MDDAEKEFHISRILCGKTILDLDLGTYLYYRPTDIQLYKINIEFNKTIKESLEFGLPDDDEVYEWLLERKLWDDSHEHKMKSIETSIEDCKVKLYNSLFRSVESKSIRQDLVKLRENYSDLYAKRHQFDHITANGISSLLKLHLTTGLSLYNEDGKQLFNDYSFLSDPNNLVTEALDNIRTNKLEDSKYRILARTEPWRHYWSISKTNVFGGCAKDLTEEQRTLILWSKMYDSIYESHDSPHESIIEDDDVLDGWLIIQRREREGKQLKVQAEQLVSKNEKIANAQNVFLMADTIDDAKRLNTAMNDSTMQMIKKQRQQVIQQQGEIKHYNLPDMKQDLMTQAHEQFTSHMKG